METHALKAVFMSYASQDAEAARRIADALRAFGVEVWFDQSELVGGDAWDAKLRQQIKECALFVPVISAATQARQEGYFRLEWHLAEQRSLLIAKGRPFIVPVSVDATAERDALVPEAFLAVQWTRLPGGQTTATFCARVKRLLGGETPVARVSLPVGLEDTDRQTRATTKRAPWFVLAIVAIAAVVALNIWQPWKVRASVAKSVAVLPFVNLGADKTDEYLGDGMTDELLNVLAKVKGLRVPGRTSCFAFKGKTEDGIFRKVGDQLHVSTVLEGSVRRAGDKLRVTAQLINVADGFQLWSSDYDGDMKDILSFQSDVARRAVQALQGHLGVDQTRALARTSTPNPEAYRLYLLGRHHWGKFSESGWQSALQYFNQAVQLDPTYALAHCGLADTYNWMGGAVISGKEALSKTKDMAQKALALDPNLAEAHVSLGQGLLGTYDWSGAEREFKRALELNPNLALAHDQRAALLAYFGRFDEAFAEQRKAMELDPLSPLWLADFGYLLYYARRFDDAIAQARRALELEPSFVTARHLIGCSLMWQGNTAAAIAEFQMERTLDTMLWSNAGLGQAYGMSGERTKAEEILRNFDDLAKKRYVSPAAWMYVHLELGEKEKALDLLDRCYEVQEVPWALKVDRTYDPLRNEPRFQALLKKMGLAR